MFTKAATGLYPNSMEQIPSCEAGSRSASEEISCLL